MSNVYILRPCFEPRHLVDNIFTKRNGRIDLKCLIHGLTCGVVFFERERPRHEKANKIHLKEKNNE